MPATTLDKLVRPAVDAAVEALWAQWRVVSPVPAWRGRLARALIDPEALVLGSLALVEQERRFGDLARVWAGPGARVLSAQRMRNLLPDHPSRVADRLAAFARTAVEHGDLRWRPLAGRAKPLRARAKDPTTGLISREPAALVLRLRLGFGVGIKPDVLAFLLGVHGTRQTVPAIAAATHYYQRAVRRAMEDLAAGGFVRSQATAPASYSVDIAVWRELLQFGEDPPVWRSWHSLFSFVSRLVTWVEEVGGRDLTHYVLSSRARDFLEAERPRLETALRLPDPTGYAGERYLKVFEKSLAEVSDWLRASA